MATEAIRVNMDIYPTSCPNSYDMRDKGAMSVAIVGKETFDVSNIDSTTLEISGVKPMKSGTEDVATPFDGELVDGLSCTVLGADGWMDLTMRYDTATLIKAIGDTKDFVIVEMTGYLLDGTPIVGEDVIYYQLSLYGLAHLYFASPLLFSQHVLAPLGQEPD